MTIMNTSALIKSQMFMKLKTPGLSGIVFIADVFFMESPER